MTLYKSDGHEDYYRVVLRIIPMPGNNYKKSRNGRNKIGNQNNKRYCECWIPRQLSASSSLSSFAAADIPSSSKVDDKEMRWTKTNIQNANKINQNQNNKPDGKHALQYYLAS